MDKNWNFTSFNNDHTKINLNGFTITDIEYGDEYLALIFGNGFGVSETCGDSAKQHRLTGHSAVMLRGGKLLYAGFPGGTMIKEGKTIKYESQPLDSIENLLGNITITYCGYDASDRKFTLQAALQKEIPDSVLKHIMLNYECDEPLYCWNGYADDSWYNALIKAIYGKLALLGFELHDIDIVKHGKTDKLTVFKYPGIAAVYAFMRLENSPGLAFVKAADLTAASINEFVSFMTFSCLYSAQEFAKSTEYILRREHFIIPTIIPGEWNAVETDADIERLQIYFGHFHDSFIVGLEYTTGFKIITCEHIQSGWSYDYVVNMRVQSSAVKDAPIIEMRFEDIKRCGFTGAFTEFFGSYLQFVEGLDRYNKRSIVWAGEPSFDPHNITGEINSAAANFVIATGLKWRLLEADKPVTESEK